MAIHTEQQQELQGGFTKTIEESAMTMVLDNLQKSQYQYPVKSTVRELVSNAVDSIKEKFNALAILSGVAKEEDFYIRRDDPMYKDSNFDPLYYDPKYLSQATTARIIYEESGLERDKVRIIDQGVGLGGKRLDGYFKLAWSSKRNSKSALGKFGIGAKAALSTGVPFYTVINRYNGKEFHFNVYSHKVDSIIPERDITTGKWHSSYVMYRDTDHPYSAFYIETDKPNGLEVVIDVKKHKKQEFIDAVKSQLLYFDGVELILKHADGHEEIIPFKANVLYENEYLIVSDNTQFSKPHLILNKVNYGYVDFQELELEQKFGNVGIKVAPEEVEVNPSRESVMWSEFTKNTIQNRFKQAAEAATHLIEEKLKVPDFFGWLRTWASTRTRWNNKADGDVISKLAGIIDIQALEPAFSLDNSIKISRTGTTFSGISIELVTKDETKKGGKVKRKLEREELRGFYSIEPETPIYLTNKKPSVKTQRYLATMYPSGFYLVRYPENLDVTEEQPDMYWIKSFEFSTTDLDLAQETLKTKGRRDLIQYLVQQRKNVVGYMEASSIPLQLESVTVPDDFSWTEEEGTEVDDEGVEAAIVLTAEERRRLEERVVAFTPRYLESTPTVPKTVYERDVNGVITNRDFDPEKDAIRLFEWQKVEPKLAEIQSLEGDDIYYGSGKDEEMLHLAALLSQRTYYPESYKQQLKDNWGMNKTWTFSSHRTGYWGPEAKVTLLKVAQDQVKHYTNYRHISEFFIRTENDTITMSKPLIKWHTARLIADSIPKLKFLDGFEMFNKDKADKYQELKKYYEANYLEVAELVEEGGYFAADQEAYRDLIAFHDKVTNFQLFIRQNPDDKETIAELSKNLFGASFQQSIGVDLVIWDTLQELLEYAEPISTLLNQVPLLTEAKKELIGEELEAEIRSYIAFKGL